MCCLRVQTFATSSEKCKHNEIENVHNRAKRAGAYISVEGDSTAPVVRPFLSLRENADAVAGGLRIFGIFSISPSNWCAKTPTPPADRGAISLAPIRPVDWGNKIDPESAH